MALLRMVFEGCIGHNTNMYFGIHVCIYKQSETLRWQSEQPMHHPELRPARADHVASSPDHRQCKIHKTDTIPCEVACMLIDQWEGIKQVA